MRLRPDGPGDGLPGGQDQPGSSDIVVPQPQREVVPELIKAAMEGTLATSRALKKTEPLKLSPTHINMIMDRAAGWTPTEIAQKHDYTLERVSHILNHPYAEVIIGAILGSLAERVTDPLERIRAYQHEMIDVKIQIVRDPTTPKALRNQIADDFLDRAGLTATRKVEVQTPVAPSLPPALADRVVQALEAAKAVLAVPYDRYLTAVKAVEGGIEVQSDPNPPEAVPASQPTGASALPGSPSQSTRVA